MNSEASTNTAELEKMEKEVLATMKVKSKDGERKRDMHAMMDQLQNVVKAEIAGLLEKIEPALKGQERAQNALVEAFDEFLANVAAEKEPSPSPPPGNEENVVPEEDKEEEAKGQKENVKNLAMPQAREGGGQFRARAKGYSKGGGYGRSVGRPWDRAQPNCQCWSCRRAKGWHGRGGGRGGGGAGYGYGMRGGRGAQGRGHQQYVGPSRH